MIDFDRHWPLLGGNGQFRSSPVDFEWYQPREGEEKPGVQHCSSLVRSVTRRRFLLLAQGVETSPLVGRRNEATMPVCIARYRRTIPYRAELGMPIRIDTVTLDNKDKTGKVLGRQCEEWKKRTPE
ncbi:hypothetical protein BHM03_00020589 [Ensete ventricosum]|nr:hypothetical protein BHM03_00020589 [Ensete ventricosum]